MEPATMKQPGEREAKPAAPVIEAAEAMLSQCEALLRAFTDDLYRSPSALLAGGTIGKHVRHTLDHFGAIVRAARGSEPIDYDHRERGGEVELSVESACGHAGSLRTAIAALRGEGARPVRVRVMIDADGAEAELDSTLAREVAFATHHAVHHVAMIRAIATEFGVKLGADVGRAPSTSNYERSGAR